MSASTGASIYEKFEITSREQNKTVSIINGVIDFQYFEDLYSPIVTALAVISNTGNTINGQGLYHGLPIIGGEQVNIKIKTPFDVIFNKPESFEYTMIVDKVTNYISDRQMEGFVLHLTSREAITAREVRVSRKYTGMTIDKTLSNIIGLLKPIQPVDFEKTETVWPLTGNMKLPFWWAIKLAARAVPVGAKSDSAGFFFWQTKRGFNFKSMDGLSKNAIKNRKDIQKYFYRQTFEDGYRNPQYQATTLLDFRVNKTIDLSDSISRGEYSSKRIFIDPYSQNVTQSKLVSKGGTKLGENSGPPEIADPKNQATHDARTFVGVFNVGTLDVGVSTNRSYDPLDSAGQAAARYSSFGTIDCHVLIPVNTNLCAGDPVYLEFPKVSIDSGEMDRRQSGLYIIKEITHKFLPNKSYTAMRLVKDAHGIKTKN